MFDLPIDIPIKLELLADNRSAEVVLTYDNKFDYYHLNWDSSIRSFRERLDEIPKKQSEDLPEINDVEFKCPFRIVDDEDYAIIIIAETYVYSADKVTFEVTSKHYPYYFDCNFFPDRLIYWL